jgi:hypothetical protein
MKSFILLLISITSFTLSCNYFSPGSYPYAEIYQYKIDGDSLIKILTVLKEKDCSLMPPIELGLTDGRSDSTDYWYHIYFFNKSENEIIHTWIRKQDKEITNLAFVGINQGLQLGNWKEINKDYNKVDNNKKKEEFQNLILKRINVHPISSK